METRSFGVAQTGIFVKLRFAKYKIESNSVNGFIKKIRSELHVTDTPNTSFWSGYRHHGHYPLRTQQVRHANSLLLIFVIKALTGFTSDMLEHIIGPQYFQLTL